jgi:antitoxin StbD
MLTDIHADLAVSISDLKRNPQAVVDEAAGGVVALLNRSKPVAYIVPAETYGQMMELLEEGELCGIINSRKDELHEAAEIPLAEL